MRGWNVPFMMAAFYLFLICSAVLVLISWRHPHQPTEDSARLVWSHPLESLQFRGWSGIGNYKLLAALLFVSMILLYIRFHSGDADRESVVSSRRLDGRRLRIPPSSASRVGHRPQARKGGVL